MVEIVESKGPIDEFVVSICEMEWEVRLPRDYRAFLIKHNGGLPKPDVFEFKGQQAGSSVNRFFHIGLEKNYSITEQRKVYKGRIPNDLFPIACDPFGNLICIATRGKQYGALFFWDHEWEAECGIDPDYSNVTPIADTFNEFLEGLHEIDDDTGIE